MKQFFLALFMVLAFVSGTKAQAVQDVDAVKFKSLISPDALLLDVRTPGEYTRGHIAGSTNINIADPAFPSRIGLLQKDKTILVYCLSGSRSDAAAAYMSRQGFKKIYTLYRGIMTWSNAGFPLEQSSQTIASAATSYTPQSFEKLLKENKLVLIDFNAVWCAPCKQMIPVVDKVSADFKGKARVEKVDVEANKALTTAYQVQSIPGFVLFKDGKKVWSYSGIISYNDLSGVIKKYL
ncbi:MAG: thioredoxin domain-containing protein [Prolixibacteraceae bacterium]|jgi:thioredoxin